MRLESGWRAYLKKWRGTTAGGPPRVSNAEVFWSWLGAFLGIDIPTSRRYPEIWF